MRLSPLFIGIPPFLHLCHCSAISVFKSPSIMKTYYIPQKKRAKARVICGHWSRLSNLGQSYSTKNWKVDNLRVSELRENSKTDISSDQKIRYMIVLQCILLDRGMRKGMDLSKNLKILNLNKNTIRIGTDFKDRAHHVKVWLLNPIEMTFILDELFTRNVSGIWNCLKYTSTKRGKLLCFKKC